MILSDFGAEVIKVDRPAGEMWRIGHKIPRSRKRRIRTPFTWPTATSGASLSI